MMHSGWKCNAFTMTTLSLSSRSKNDLERADVWWARVKDIGNYPLLSRMATAVLSCFHGPEIEKSFSMMAGMVTSQTASISIPTVDAIQTVKQGQLAAGKSAVEFFKRKDKLHDPVDAALIRNMTTASRAYNAELNDKKKSKAKHAASMDAPLKTPATKRQAKDLSLQLAKKAKLHHVKKINKKYK